MLVLNLKESGARSDIVGTLSEHDICVAFFVLALSTD